MNPFYDHENYPQNGAPGSSAAMRSELGAIETGFDLVEQEILNALTGAEGAVTLATLKAAEALASANNADISEAAALASQIAAALSEANAAASEASALLIKNQVDETYDLFDDRYLGNKPEDPLTDNDGNPLQPGTLYFNTTLATFRGYNGTVFISLPATQAINILFTPYGNLLSTNVQSAIQELDDIKITNADNQVLTNNIIDNAINTPKINAEAVTAEKIAPNAVTTEKILDSNVTGEKIVDDVILPGLEGVKIPVGTTAQRPISPTNGYIRYNTDLVTYEGYSNGAWGSIGGGATGGSTDNIFYLNDQVVTTSYTIPMNQNAMTAGAIAISDGVIVTIPDDSTWTIV